MTVLVPHRFPRLYSRPRSSPHRVTALAHRVSDRLTPTPSPSASASSSSASSSSRSAATPDWSDMSRRSRHILRSILPNIPPDHFQTALHPHLLRHPSNPFLWHALLMRLCAHFGKDYHLLPSLLTQALTQIPPGFRGAIFHFEASLLLHRREAPAALRLLTDAIATDPYPPLYIALASLNLHLNHKPRSRDAYRAGVAAFPRHAAIWRAWAAFEAVHGSREAALHTCREALDRDPTNPRAWRMLIQLQMKFDAGDAHLIDVLQEALTACPHDAVLRLHLARIVERRKGSRAAYAVLAPIEHTDHPDVMRTLGRIIFQQGDLSKARSYLRRAADCERSPPDTQSKSLISTDDSSESNVSSASSARKPKQYSRQHKAVKALHAWALMEAKVGNVDEARSLLTEARSLCQTDAGIWRAIAELESREKNYDLARKAFQNALSIDANDPRIYLAWGRTEALAGNVSKAEALIAKVDQLPRNRRNGLRDEIRSRDRPITHLFNLNDRDTQTNDELSSPLNHSKDDDRGSSNVSLTPNVLAAALRERAMLASSEGRFDDSVRLLTRASRVDPSDEVGWRLLASHEMRVKGIDRLREIYRRALELVENRSKPKLLHWWGQDERAHGFSNEARQLFRKATVANPDYMSAWMSWGLLEKSSGNVDAACDIFEQATRRAEQDAVRAPFIFQAWGRVEEVERGRPDVAASIFARGVKLAPSSGTLWTAWGLLEGDRGNVEHARSLFEKGTDADAKNGSAWHSWALLESRRCNFQKAGELFQKGHDQDRNDASLITSWAWMEGKDLNNVAVGRDLFERATQADALFTAAWRKWGMMEMDCGNLNRARDLFGKAGDCAAAWHCLGVLEWEKCRSAEQAEKMWKRGLEISSVHAPIYEQWALMESERGNIAESREVLETGLKLKSDMTRGDYAMLLQTMAKLEYDDEKDEALARQLIQRSLGAFRKRWQTWDLLARMEYALGRKARALQILKEGMSVCKGTMCSGLYMSAASMMVDGQANMKDARRILHDGIIANPSDSVIWERFQLLERQHGFTENAHLLAKTQSLAFMRTANAESDIITLTKL